MGREGVSGLSIEQATSRVPGGCVAWHSVVNLSAVCDQLTVFSQPCRDVMNVAARFTCLVPREVVRGIAARALYTQPERRTDLSPGPQSDCVAGIRCRAM